MNPSIRKLDREHESFCYMKSRRQRDDEQAYRDCKKAWLNNINVMDPANIPAYLNDQQRLAWSRKAKQLTKSKFNELVEGFRK